MASDQPVTVIVQPVAVRGEAEIDLGWAIERYEFFKQTFQWTTP